MKVNRKVKLVCKKCVRLDGKITTTVILPIITAMVLNANDTFNIYIEYEN